MRLYYVEHELITIPIFFWAEDVDEAKAEWQGYVARNYPGINWAEEEEPLIDQVWADNKDTKYRGYVTKED